MGREANLIPSGYKSKIPRTLVWPIKAQELSAALAEVPQFDELKLNFRFYQSDLAAFQWSWMTLLRVDYSRRDRGFSSSRSMAERGWHNKTWNIIITPVPSSEAKIIRDHLLPALPKVAEWLTQNNTLQTVGTKSVRVVWEKKKDEVYLSTETALQPERIGG